MMEAVRTSETSVDNHFTRQYIPEDNSELQEFAAAVEQLVHRALVRLPVGFIQREAAHAFIDGVWDRKVKQHLLMGGDRTLNEALNQAVKLKAAKAAAVPPAWLPLRKVVGTPAPPTESHRRGRTVCWQCGSTGHLRKGCPSRPAMEVSDN
jgi:hypothetical protein